MTKTAIFGFRAWLPLGDGAAACSLLAQSIAGRTAYNNDQPLQQEDPVSWAGYVGSADFWNRILQNWQSEFLAVDSTAAFAIFLRQRGSPESKPVGASHQATGAG